MKVRAVIFDIYGTLLTFGPPPPDAGRRWDSLWRGALSIEPRASLAEFEAATATLIAREHAVACASGVSYPEIMWPEIVCEVIPELDRRPGREVDDFITTLAGILHTSCLKPGAADALHQLSKDGLELGLASNSQAYTLRELDRSLAPVRLSRDLFNPALSFYSFEHGYSKPDPRVFRLLTGRLRARGISPEETMMVGNRLDNDIEPARAQGWRAWQLTDTPAALADGTGDWNQLLRRLSGAFA
jgi:FMN phosphatase YigB (HAD superfamily)